MFNKLEGGFYRGIKPRDKKIPGKACLNEVDNNDALVNVGN